LPFIIITVLLPPKFIFEGMTLIENILQKNSLQSILKLKINLMGQNLIYVIPVFGVLALLYTFWKSGWVSKQDVGTDKMAKIANHISEGAMSFLKAEYKVLSIFVIAVAILLGISGNSAASSPLVALSFILGAICSALAGFIGMKVATKANVRTTSAARSSLGKALEVAFAGGAVMGLGVVGLGVLGLGGLFLLYSNMFNCTFCESRRWYLYEGSRCRSRSCRESRSRYS